MTNNKVKITPASPLAKLRDEMLFIRHFQQVTDLTPDQARTQLADLDYQPDRVTRVFFPRQRFVEFDEDDDITHFTVNTKVGGLYTELRATGTIHYDSATRKTIVSGRVTFDAVYLAVLLTGLFMLITWGLASLSREGITASPFIMFTLGLTNLFYFRQMFRDRRALLDDLSERLHTVDVSSAEERLSDRIIELSQDNFHYTVHEEHNDDSTQSYREK